MSEAPRPSPFRDPRMLIAVGIGAGVVLIVSIVAVLLSGSDGTPTDQAISTSTTASTTTTTTTTTLPPLAVANAGDDLTVDASSTVTLTALDLSEPDQSVVWRQIAGLDVTGGTGEIQGATVEFVAPVRPATLRFEVDVTGLGGDVATDDLRIDVLANAHRAVFVGGPNASSDGDGTRDRPYASLAAALNGAGGADIYLSAMPPDGSYQTDGVPLSTSVYGGYDADWVRTDARTPIAGDAAGWRVSGADVIISQVDYAGVDGSELVTGIKIRDAGSVTIEDSSVLAGLSSTGISIGIVGRESSTIALVRTSVRAGAGGLGLNGGAGEEPTTGATGGKSTSGRSGAAGGDPGGGNGGNGAKGVETGKNGGGDNGGGRGAGGLVVDPTSGVPGGRGAGGRGGRGGNGGNGLATFTAFVSPSDDQLPGLTTLFPVGETGAAGEQGSVGQGGGGGGGGGSASKWVKGGA